MKKVYVDCELQYLIENNSDLIFNIQAAHHEWQELKNEKLTFNPNIIASYGKNHIGDNKLLRVSNVSGLFSVRYEVEVDVNYPQPSGTEIEIKVSDLPIEIIPYIWSSRYCESDAISSIATQNFGNTTPGYIRVEAICEWIRQNIKYQPGMTNSITSTLNVLNDGFGVCRDFAHLGISFCRALNIPARFVTGYARFESPPNDFHAIFEAYLGNRWVLFDPTRLSPVDELVRIATGRDASDSAFCNTFGTVKMTYMNPMVNVYSG